MLAKVDWSLVDEATLVRSSGDTWKVGALASAAGALAQGTVVLGTRPAEGSYAAGRDEWVELPALDLTGYEGCDVRARFELFRDTEGTTGRRDGGNLQATADPGAGPGASWQVLDGGDLLYDGALTSASCGASCWLAGQPVWSGRPAAVKEVSAPLGAFVGKAGVTLRFTFHSDGVIQYRGIAVGTIEVEAK